MTNRPCKNCGKSQATTRAGSVTSYFFQHNYCQCQKKPAEAKQEKHPSSDSNSSSSPKEQSPRICTNCGKARPEDRRIGSFTSFLFKELRCQCASTSVAKKRNADLDNRGDSSSSKGDGMGNLSGSRSQTASRVAQKRQFATKFKAGSQSQTAGQPYCQSGTIIGGTFKIISIIGEGGMGVVYLVNHLGLNKPFALKVLTPNLVNEQNWLRFQAEARTLSALNHSSLVKVYDLGIHEKTVPFYSMDYLKGRNLEEILCQQGRLELKQALAVFLTMLDGLAYAHRNGVVHRDIKPANIFICSPASTTNESANQVIDDETEVKILDFGISKLVSSANKSQHLTSAGEIFGSPYYMSPEQCRGEAVDARSDIYSVGCTLFEALTGFVPFEGKNGMEISLMHEEDEPPRLEDVLPNNTFPPGLDQVLAKCLAKLPQNRYQSAKELAIDLTRIKEGRQITSYGSAASVPHTTQTQTSDNSNNQIAEARAIFGFLALIVIAIILSFPTIEKFYINRPLLTLSRLKPTFQTKREEETQTSQANRGRVTTVLSAASLPGQALSERAKQIPNTTELHALVGLFPQSAKVLADIARCYEDKHMWRQAIDCGRLALTQFEIDSKQHSTELQTPSDAELRALNHYNYCQLMTGANEEAIKVLTKIIALQPASWIAHEERATAYRKLGRLNLAREDDRIALKLKADNKLQTNTHEEITSATVSNDLRSGDLESGIADASVVLERHPKDIAARVLRARCYLQIGQYKLALKDYQAIPERIKASPHIRTELEAARALDKSGPPPYGDLSILKEAEPGADGKPSETNSETNGANNGNGFSALKKIRRTELALRDRKTDYSNLYATVQDKNGFILKLAGDHKGDCRVYRAICEELEKNSLIAPLDAELSKLLTIAPDSIDAVGSKIATTAILQNWKATENLCSKYLELFASGFDPGCDTWSLRCVYSTRATARRWQRNFAGTIEDQTTLLKLAPISPDAIRDRAGCYMQTSQYEKAAADYSNYIKLKNAKSGNIYRLRAQAYEKMNRLDLAKQDMEQANIEP